MERLLVIIISVATLLNAILAIITFIQKTKNIGSNIVENRFKEALEPLAKKIDKLDMNQCRNYLVDFLSDVENGIKKDDIQVKRAYELYDHYTIDLKGNSYIHDKWERLMKKEKYYEK